MSLGALEINKKRIKQNLQEVFRMEVLVEDLSELMKLEEPELKLCSTSIETKEFINQIVYRNREELKSRDISLIIKNHANEFVGDEMLLHRAISNIWTNAVRHTHNGGNITLSVKFLDKDLVINISNSGDVIPKEELKCIFNRLFRGETARNSLGSGLGLTICEKIITLHGGSIGVTSTSHETIFSVSIPQI